MCIVAFGFTAALLEGLPLVGLIFTVSNRIGAAMWAHGGLRHPFVKHMSYKRLLSDLEKRQHYVAQLRAREMK